MSLTVSNHSLVVRATMGIAKLWLVYLCLVVVSSYSAPLDAAKGRKEMEELRERLREIRDMPGLDKEEYLRYWQEVAKNDPKVLNHLKNIGDLHHGNERADIKRLIEDNPLLGERLARGSDDIRSRLEEAKRMNVEQMRQLQRLQMLREDNTLKDGDWNTKLEALREKLPPKFTDEDIQARIREQNRVLEDIDKKRREEFKRAEMHSEHRRRELLKAMDEKKRLKAEEEFQAEREKLRHHEKINHPASEEQLEDVWEKEDGLNRDDFDPKTFFHLHDKNSDRHLDAAEWEALFYNELRKVYGDDMGGMEAHEDLARMREHVIDEMDKDDDGLISMQEFITYTKDGDFKDDNEWKSVKEEDNFSDKEFEKYEDDYDQYYDYEYDEDGNLVGYKTKQKGTETEEETPDRMPEKDLPHEQGDRGVPQVNEQGHPPNNQGDPGVPKVNEQGNPPVVRPDSGLPAELKVPQIDDPMAVHVNGMDKNVDQEVPVVRKPKEGVPQQNPNEV